MFAVNMPQVGQDIPRAKIIEWTKQVNDPVAKGEVIAVVESEKASFEVEADAAGVLLRVLYAVGEEGEVLRPIAYIGEPGESFDESKAEETGEPASVVAAAVVEAAAAPTAPTDRLFVSPSARRIATEHRIDLSTLTGTGPGGRIVKADVLAAVEAAPVAALAEDTEIPFDRMRAAIARRLTHSKRTAPHFYLKIDVDMTAAGKWRKASGAQPGVKITITDMVIQAAAKALRQFPSLNAIVDETKTVWKKDVNIGVAVAVDNGLLVPVIAGADTKTLAEISAESRANAESARRGVITPGTGTFTISTLGMYGIREFLPIINAPECAILGVGAVAPRAVPVGDAIGIRDMMTLTLVCDHRAADGPEAAGLLNAIKDTLENEYTTG